MLAKTLDPSPFTLRGGTVGILLIHGMSSSPTEVRLIGEYLHQRGLTVSAPLLPGHGTTIDDLHRQRWQDWAHHVETAFADLKTRSETVFVAGISLGSLLTLYLAAHHPDLAGAIVYSPLIKMPGGIAVYFLPLAKRRRPELPKQAEFYTDPNAAAQVWSYPTMSASAVNEMAHLSATVRSLLPRVTAPLLIIHSTRDRLIVPGSAQYTYDHVCSEDKTLITLNNSGHTITVDSEWQTVAEHTHQFIERCISSSSEQSEQAVRMPASLPSIPDLKR